MNSSGSTRAWSLNLLSISTLVAMLVIVMTLGEVLFNSRAVGRLGSLLFFFFGSLSYVPFLHKQASVRGCYSSDHTSAGLSSDDLSVSRRCLGYVVSGDLSQSATLRHRDRDTPSRFGFSRDPLSRGGGEETKVHGSSSRKLM